MLKYLQNRCFRPKYRFYMIFYRKIENMTFYFVPGIILDHFRHPKSIFWYPKLKISWNFTKKLDQKINFLYKNRFLGGEGKGWGGRGGEPSLLSAMAGPIGTFPSQRVTDSSQIVADPSRSVADPFQRFKDPYQISGHATVPWHAGPYQVLRIPHDPV